MSSAETLAALKRATVEMNKALAAYGELTMPVDIKQARRRVEQAMDAYEKAMAAHLRALAQQIEKLGDDPRHTRPPRGRTKGL